MSFIMQVYIIMYTCILLYSMVYSLYKAEGDLMRLCKSCALDHECYYFFMYPFSWCDCDGCGDTTLCFNVELDQSGGACYV